MKTLILFLSMALVSLTAKSQEYLGKSEKDITDYVTKNEGYVETKYTKDGIKFLFCTYSIKRIDLTDIAETVYYLDDNNLCAMYLIHFQNQNALDGLVSLTKMDAVWERETNKFAWINHQRKCEMEIIIDDDNKGFVLLYKTVPDK